MRVEIVDPAVHVLKLVQPIVGDLVFQSDEEVHVAGDVEVAEGERAQQIPGGERVSESFLGAGHELVQHGVEVRIGSGFGRPHGSSREPQTSVQARGSKCSD
jgi:hypothetical protein